MSGAQVPPLTFKLLSECSVSKARVACMTLRHGKVDTPVFMPVGTKGTIKGVLPEQLVEMDCQILLGNTYHLGNRPGIETLKRAGGLHNFMSWPRCLLTDSGGFQMVSLLDLAEINEQGVQFQSPFDGTNCMLTPEYSIEIQNVIGADIIMQLDDVIKSTTTGKRVDEAMHRTVRWLDRCVNSHDRDDDQSLFPVVQGGLDPELRQQCIQEMIERPVRGIAIGGLSGGESKENFWQIVLECTQRLPKDKPRYLMGVGYATDLVVCVALGVDMFDCVFPTRTARFGYALVRNGQLKLKDKQYELDFRPIAEDCDCVTCKRYTRSYLHHIAIHENVASSLISIHNIAFQIRLMRSIREAILRDEFPSFICQFMKQYYNEEAVPIWICKALAAVDIHLPSSHFGEIETSAVKEANSEQTTINNP